MTTATPAIAALHILIADIKAGHHPEPALSAAEGPALSLSRVFEGPAEGPVEELRRRVHPEVSPESFEGQRRRACPEPRRRDARRAAKRLAPLILAYAARKKLPP